MKNQIHRIVISAYCTLILSSTFLTVGDGVLFTGAVSGFQALEAKVHQGLAGLDAAGFEGVRGWQPAIVRVAQGSPAESAKTEPLSVPALITIARQTGGDSPLHEKFARELGIPLLQGESKIAMKGRSMTNNVETRMIASPADAGREYLVFVVERASELEFLLTTPSGRLEKAILYSKNDGAVREIPRPDAERRFAWELWFWQAKLGPSPVAN